MTSHDLMEFQIPGNSKFIKPFAQASNKKNVKISYVV